MASFRDFIFGKSPKVKKAPTRTSEQMEILKMLLQQGGGLEGSPLYQGGSDFLQKLFSGDFEAFEAPLKRQFEEVTAPGIAERYAGLGATSSSGLDQSLARAGENLVEQLGSQRSQLMMQALPQALGYAEAPINKLLQLLGISPFENIYEKGDMGLVGSGLSAFGKSFGGGFGSGFGKSVGSKVG